MVAWGSYIQESLRQLIETRTGRPNTVEGTAALEAARARLAALGA